MDILLFIFSFLHLPSISVWDQVTFDEALAIFLFVSLSLKPFLSICPSCRLLREMGWHEHSDNEEGYAPITEDERQEFKLRSQQVSSPRGTFHQDVSLVGFDHQWPQVFNNVSP